MTKVSTTHADLIEEMGPVLDRASTADGHTVELVTFKEHVDMTPVLASLPGGNCSCPHWGYVFSGRMTVHYADHDDVIEAGDAFYMAPGHVPEVVAGTEFVMFSPADLLAETEAAIAEGMQEAASAG